MAAKAEDLLLHRAVFKGDYKVVEQLLKNAEEKQLNRQDIHGNTALHIAVMKGDRKCVELLVKSGAITTIRNQLDWMSVHEAISFGDIAIIKILNDSLSQRMVRYLKREYLFKVVNDIKEDFVMRFELRFKDYNPSHITGPPELKITLTKKGLKLRADVQILERFHSRPEVFHLIFNLNENNSAFITITVGEHLPFYQTVTFDEWNQILTEIYSRESSDEEIRNIMQRENVSIKIESSSDRSKRPVFRKGITKTIGSFRTVIYESQGMDFNTKTRTEHLRPQNQSTGSTGQSTGSTGQSTGSTGQSTGSTGQTSGSEPRPPPPVRHVSWDEYINAPKGKFPYLGREAIETSETKRISIVVGLTDQISYDWKWIIGLAEQICSYQFVSLLTGLSTELPKGFPVVIDFPIKASVYMKWKLNSFETVSNIEDQVFNVPQHYEQRTIFRIERNVPSNQN